MKKIVLTLFSFFVLLTSRAQVAEFFSLQSAFLLKNSKGDFLEAKEWIGQEIYINFNLSDKKVEFFLKGMFDRDTFRLVRDILLSDKSAPSKTVDGQLTREFPGKDRSGKECLVKLKLSRDAYRTQDGELRIEYPDGAVVYKIRAVRDNPRFNNS